MYDKSFSAVVVVFNPDKNFFSNLKQLSSNFNKVYVVLNSIVNIPTNTFNNLVIIKNHKNLGLAKALNVGIKNSISDGFKYVSLFDQDTYIPDNYISSVSKEINFFLNLNSNSRVAVFVPNHYNKLSKKILKFTNSNPFFLFRSYPNKLLRFQKIEYGITSGSIINVDILRKIGFMDENLFIDFIDIEWCHRSRSYGYIVVALNKLKIFHVLGDEQKSIFGKKFPIHSPLRIYYFYRNFIYLLSLRHIDFRWKLFDFFRNILRIFFYIFFVNNRFQYGKYILKGIYHGLIKKMGELKN